MNGSKPFLAHRLSLLAGAAGLALLFAGGTLTGTLAQHPGGSTGGSHDAESGHGGAGGGCGGAHGGPGGGCGGDHGEDHGDGHEGGKGGKGGKGSGGGDIEDKVFRWQGGRKGSESIEDRILRQGQKPAWAGGAVPEDLELGRLNVARAPESMRAHALAEVYATNLDRDGNGVIDADADPDAIDSPVANLALYEQAMESGAWPLEQAAKFLGRAADKSIAITAETVGAVNLILGVPDIVSVIDAFHYDRSQTYSPEIIESVFAGQNYSGGGMEAFARAADDERAVIEYQHDHSTEAAGS